jgi:hypothetical protein
MRKYYDVDGNEVSLHTLCSRDPGWASSRIQHMTEANEVMENTLAHIGRKLDVTPGDVPALLEAVEKLTNGDKS